MLLPLKAAYIMYSSALAMGGKKASQPENVVIRAIISFAWKHHRGLSTTVFLGKVNWAIEGTASAENDKKTRYR